MKHVEVYFETFLTLNTTKNYRTIHNNHGARKQSRSEIQTPGSDVNKVVSRLSLHMGCHSFWYSTLDEQVTFNQIT
jgi:hypothetical protein